MKERDAFHKKAALAEEAEKRKATEKHEALVSTFWSNLEKSDDPQDNLGELAQFIHENVGSTGVYIGELEPPFQPIEEDADE